MPTLQIDLPARSVSSEAEKTAARNWTANLSEIEALQPELAAEIRDLELTVEYVFARDGLLTCLDANGHWFSGCSVPLHTAEAMLPKLTMAGTTACLLAAPHAAHIDVALRAMKANQAIVTVVEDLIDLATILRLHDFSPALRAHRLFFAAGKNWPAQLDKLLTDIEGLPLPTSFLRLPLLENEDAERMIVAAQSVFERHTSSRNERMKQFAAARPTRAESQPPRLCLIAPSHFRLWNDAGHALAETLASDFETARYDSDDPAGASHVALCKAAASADAIVAADVSRADVPGVASPDVPWITWITAPSVPPCRGPNDQLLLSDASWREIAQRAGWPDDRIHVAGWPTLKVDGASSTQGSLSIIADTFALECDNDRFELSSHRLLWEHIAGELTADPFQLGKDPAAYLASRMKRLNVNDEAFDRDLFTRELLGPAYAQGLARCLIARQIPIQLFGQGWAEIPFFAPYHCGVINERRDFECALASSSAVVHVWPEDWAHCIESLGIPLVPQCADRKSFLHHASQPPVPVRSGPVLSPQLIRSVLRA